MAKIAANFVLRASYKIPHLEFDRVTLFDGVMKRWNGRISYNAECLVA